MAKQAVYMASNRLERMGAMAKQTIHLDLSREQLWQWYGHIFVYMACRALHVGEPDPRAMVETIQELGIRLFSFCQQEGPHTVLTLNAEEIQAMLHVLEVVQMKYENSPSSEHRTLALAHLFTCRALIRQAMSDETGGEQP